MEEDGSRIILIKYFYDTGKKSGKFNYKVFPARIKP